MRLASVVAAALDFMTAEGSGTENFFPYVVYTAPNALFPLMALFLLLHLEAYRPYLSLYMAGKTVSAASATVWLIFFSRNIPSILYTGEIQALVFLGMVVIFVFADVLSIGGVWFLRNRLREREIAATVYGGTECV
jgi:hypothetical protein